MTEQTSLSTMVSTASIDDFDAAAERIGGAIIRSPLLPCSAGGRTGGGIRSRTERPTGARTIRLKSECLQPFGSFKIRPATNVVSAMDPELLRRGVATASAGNFAQGLALATQRRKVPLTVHAPDTAAKVKLKAIRALDATVVTHSFADWWAIISTRDTGADDGVFVHPVCEPGVILGNGTIGLELAEQWPEMDTVVIPFGGGGLACGIALALQALSREVHIVACEIETATPLTAAFAAGHPVQVQRRPSFVDGIGSSRVLNEMWPLLRELIDQVIVVSLADATAALRELALRHHLVAEGAGAVALAAAGSAECPGRNIAAVISGGNIDLDTFSRILSP